MTDLSFSGKWIDIKDSLPKDRQQVLIAHREGGVMQADYYEVWVKTIPPKGGFKPYFLTPFGDERYEVYDAHPQITHWCALPKSPVI